MRGSSRNSSFNSSLMMLDKSTHLSVASFGGRKIEKNQEDLVVKNPLAADDS